MRFVNDSSRIVVHCRNDLRSMDVAYRRCLRSLVGLPRNMDWASPCHKILHIWNERVRAFTSQIGSEKNIWSEICLRHHRNLAQCFATLPRHRWIKTVLVWQPRGHRRIGRPKYSWDGMITNFLLRDDFSLLGDRRR